MHGLRHVLLAFGFFAGLGLYAFAQDAISVDEAALHQHLDRVVTPVYPPLAKAAHIQGTVVFAITVDKTGKVATVKVVSGPAMLQQAAMDSLRQWTFHPFLNNGVLVPATGNISIPFVLSEYHPGPNDEQIAASYFPLSDQCRKAIASRTDSPGAETVCNRAAETAEQFGPEVRFIEKRSAFVYSATACANNRDWKSALAWADKAVEVVKLGHDDNAGSNAAYTTKGTIEGIIGELAASDQDLTIAEDYGRKGISWVEKEAPSLRAEYVHPLVQDLQFHAKVLQALGRTAEAQMKLDEAEKYSGTAGSAGHE